MKSTTIILGACFAIAYAAVVSLDTNALLKRATELETQGSKVVAGFHNRSKSFLIENLVTELANVKKTADDLKKAAANNKTTTIVLESIKKALHEFESRATEELEVALEVERYNVTGKSANEMINYGEKLIDLAKEEVAKHAGHTQHHDVAAINRQIVAIERAIHTLATDGSVMRRHDAEVSLYAAELALHILFKKLAQGHF